MYVATLAPGATFWDAGEFIAAAHGFGIPHPPGTPLYVALGRAVVVGLGWLTGTARAMNLLSAVATAAAGALTAWVVARETRSSAASVWGAVAAALVAGTMSSAWANATETEVYALSLLHVALLLACASRAHDGVRGARWTTLTAYLIALAPAVHLSALVGAPAAIVLAGRRDDGRWMTRRMLALAGVLVATMGVGRLSAVLVAIGLVVALAAAVGERDDGTPRVGVMLLVPLAASALLVMLVRARHDPAMNQGNPATWHALLDVIGRRQYAVPGMLPREAPAWLQAANVAQYADWQVAMGWGQGIHTSVARVVATLCFLALGVVGFRAMRRDHPRPAFALATLVLCGSAGVAAYLNLKAGASLGWGVIADTMPHEARERDYFFVLGFWGWGCLAGWGALAVARALGRPRLAVLAAAVPLAANWSTADRARGPDRDAARHFAATLLAGLPRDGVLFTSGDNDSYPLWYLQQVEGARPDVRLVTLPLLPAGWYADEVARRTGWRFDPTQPAAGALWRHELTAAAIARAARAAGRPVLASPALAPRERDLLGGGWILRGPVYVASGPATASPSPPMVDSAAAREWLARVGAPSAPEALAERMPDDVAPLMLRLLDCPRLGVPWTGAPGARDSLESRCNFR